MRSVTYWFVVIVALTVAAAIAPSPTAAQTPPAAPALPTVFIDTTLGSQPGVNRNVGTTSPGVGDRTGFINALNAAQFGDTIVLTAGAVYQGPYTLPIPQAGPGQWVVITTSDSAFLPPPGTRLVPMQAAVPPGMVANIDA